MLWRLGDLERVRARRDDQGRERRAEIVKRHAAVGRSGYSLRIRTARFNPSISERWRDLAIRLTW
jgi:hypothetical protein